MPVCRDGVLAELTVRATRGSVLPVKAKKVRAEKPTPGTVLAAKYRARGNQFGDAEREKLGDEFLKLYYGRPVSAARRR